MSERQLANYFRRKQREQLQSDSGPTTTCRFEMPQSLGSGDVKAIGFMTKEMREADRLKALSFIKGIEMPRIIDALQQSVVLQKTPPAKVLVYRCILLHPELDQKKRETFNRDVERYEEWKAKLEESRKEFGVVDSRSAAEIEEERKVQAMILAKRRGKEKSVKHEKAEEHEDNEKPVHEELDEKPEIDEVDQDNDIEVEAEN